MCIVAQCERTRKITKAVITTGTRCRETGKRFSCLLRGKTAAVLNGNAAEKLQILQMNYTCGRILILRRVDKGARRAKKAIRELAGTPVCQWRVAGYSQPLWRTRGRLATGPGRLF